MIQPKKNIQNLEAYTCARDLYSTGIFLDANESPKQWGNIDWSKVVDLNRYPDSRCDEVRQKLCDTYVIDFTIENIFIGAGSDEIIDLLIRAYVEKDEYILVTNPSYSIYQVQANINNVKVKTINLKDDFSLDIKQIISNLDDVKIIFLCSPNNPTGSLISRDDVIKLQQNFDGLIVIDEAYIEFAGMQNSLIDLVNKFDNILILRTFSKAWGLAGLRVGYSISNPNIVSVLLKIKDSYNVSKISQEVVLQALDQVKLLQQSILYIMEAKQVLEQELKSLGFEIIPTVTNFILARIDNASDIYQQVCEKGIIVRNRSTQYLLKNVIRITVGTSEENQQLVKVLKKIL